MNKSFNNNLKKIQNLREEIKKRKLHGFIISSNNEYQEEDSSNYYKRLLWITNFTGSYGIALILLKISLIFTDKRYIIQVKKETDPNIFSYKDISIDPLNIWLKQNTNGLKIGFDPRIHTIAESYKIRISLNEVGGDLCPVDKNLIDIIWHDRPLLSIKKTNIHPKIFAGHSVKTKIFKIKNYIKSYNANILIITNLSSIAWCFNIRGNDMPHTPVSISSAIISLIGKPKLFIDKKKLSKKAKQYLNSFCEIIDPSQFEYYIKYFAINNKKFLLDKYINSDYIRIIIKKFKGFYILGSDPIQKLKKIKNINEINGSINAHIRDGIALVKFFCWLDMQKPYSQTEMSVAKKLYDIKSHTAKKLGYRLKCSSFNTISAIGSNSAIIHYSANKVTNSYIKNNKLFLIDSGSQYQDGTTDITRTIYIGNKINYKIKFFFTLVLKGMIAISSLKFPFGTMGKNIDSLARINLWKYGLDYPHSTGHGVGSSLSVHEGQFISSNSSEILEPGMILSNEPGYYKENKFGIRIENILLIKKEKKFKNIKMLSFETLTLCPIDNKMIVIDLLNNEEKNWVNTYHKKIYKTLYPYLEKKDLLWLSNATKII